MCIEKISYLCKNNRSLLWTLLQNKILMRKTISIAKLQDEVKSLKEKLSRVENDYQSLDEKYQNLKIAKVIGWDQESKKAAINKIHGMVRDIDYCISFLKNK